MTLKSATAFVLQITGLVTALTGLVKSLIDLLAVRAPVKMALYLDPHGARLPAPPPPPPPTFWEQYSLFIGPAVLVIGVGVYWVAKRIRRSLP